VADEKFNQPEDEQEDVEAHSPNLNEPVLRRGDEEEDDVEAHSPNLNAPNLNAPNLN
jgi:hypothetical protein